jgi:hypothetical protein
MLNLIGFKIKNREKCCRIIVRARENMVPIRYSPRKLACVCVSVYVQDCTQACVQEPINASKNNIIKFACVSPAGAHVIHYNSRGGAHVIHYNSLPVEQ